MVANTPGCRQEAGNLGLDASRLMIKLNASMLGDWLGSRIIKKLFKPFRQ